MTALSAIGFAAGAAAATFNPDSMYPTRNANATCFDGGGYTEDVDYFCQTDNSYLTVFRQGTLSAAGRSNIAKMLGQYDATAGLEVHYVRRSNVEYTGSAETDIIYKQGTGNVPLGVEGVTWCNDAVSSRRCDQHYVKFPDPTPILNVACHETGHAVGLVHPTQANPKYKPYDERFGCLGDYVSPRRTKLDPHQVREIDATYN